MNAARRFGAYAKIEAYRKRPMIALVTSTRDGMPGMMSQDSIREMIDQVDAIDNGDSVDVMIHSAGGDPLAAWKLMSVLRERFDKVGVLVPFTAFSAATLFAMGADEIVMHPHASLGPIDPQFLVKLPSGQQGQFGYEDVPAFVAFLRDEGRLNNDAVIGGALDNLFDAVHPIMIGKAKRASDLSAEVGARLLMTHLGDPMRAAQIAEDLNKSFSAHGDAVSRSRARDLGLRVADTDVALEKLIWDAYIEIESYMMMRSPFRFEQELLRGAGGKLTAPAMIVPQVQGVPNNQVQAMVQQLITAHVQAQIAGGPPSVPFRCILAILESTRTASAFVSEGTVFGARVAGNALQVTVDKSSEKWTPVAIELPEGGGD